MLFRRILLISAIVLLATHPFAQGASIDCYSIPLPSGWEATVIPEAITTEIHPRGADGISLSGSCYISKNSVSAEAKSGDDVMNSKHLDKKLFPPMKRLARANFVTKGGVKGIKSVYSYANGSSFRQTSYIFPAKDRQLIAFTFVQSSLDPKYDPTIDAITVDAVMRSLKVY